MALRFGTAGIPIIAKGTDTKEGIKAVKKLGLDAMELEFVHSVNISEEKTLDIKKCAIENDVALTCHGQYYININSQEEKKLEASKARILKAAHIANLCGASSVTFHPGFYMGSSKESSYNRVKQALKEIIEQLKHQNNKIWIRPETTGKHSQFGDLDETIKLSSEIEQVQPCIDYAHMRARELMNTKAKFAHILEKIEKHLGRQALDNMHMQFAGVKFSDKGELNHLELKDSDLNYEEFVKTWHDFKIKGVAISESPNIEKDAILLKKVYEKK